jgi:hypothetical protein
MGVKIPKIPFFLGGWGGGNCKNLGIGRNLIEFANTPMLESLNFFYNFFYKIKKQAYFENFDRI